MSGFVILQGIAIIITGIAVIVVALTCMRLGHSIQAERSQREHVQARHADRLEALESIVGELLRRERGQ